MNACNQLLAKQNYVATYNGSGNTLGINQAISYAINEHSAMYNQNYHNIQKLNDDMIQNKDSLSASQNKLADQTTSHKKLQIYEYIAIAIFVVIGIFAAALIIFPLEKNKRLAGCGALVILSVINAFVLTFFFKNKSATYSEGFDATSVADIIYGYRTSTLAQAIAYVKNTENLSNLLQTYRTFESMNYTLNKEIGYYNDASEQLINANLKLQDFYNVSYMEDVQYSALMNLLISLSLIISGTTTAYVVSESTVTGQTYSVGIGGALSVVAITIFLLEINTRVHTDPRRMYWGAPDINNM
jgi:ABC-type multidrug transport system fused ATPase/permease subunit